MDMQKVTVSTILLERYLCGEVTEAERMRVDEACRTDAALREQIEALKRSTDGILSQYTPGDVATAVVQRSHRKDVAERVASEKDQTLPRWIPFRLSLGSFAGALVLLFGLPLIVVQVNRVVMRQETTRIKGMEPTLAIYRANDEGGYKKLSNYAPAVTGDRLQIGYQAAGKQYGIIFSVDGTGALTLHFPEPEQDVDGSCRLEQGKEQLLHTSFELDSAPLFERFYFLTSDDSINTSDVVELCRDYFRSQGVYAALRIRSIPAAIRQTTFTLKKD